MIVYIGFSVQTHKYIARATCRHFKHCAPVVIMHNSGKLYQFTKHKKICVINIKLRDLKILEHYGWTFIKYNTNCIQDINKACFTCVQFTKEFCGIKNITLQTPDALFKYISYK